MIMNYENLDEIKHEEALIQTQIERDEEELKKMTAWKIIETVMKNKSGYWEVKYVHASGHGWQNINHGNSKAQLHFDVNKFYSDFDLKDKSWDDFVKVFGEKNISRDQSKVVLENQETRYASKNKENVLNRLRSLLVELFKEEKERLQTEISQEQNESRLLDKKMNSIKKQTRRDSKNVDFDE